MASSLFPGAEWTYSSIDTIVDSENHESALPTYPVQFFRTFYPSRMSAHTITIKTGMLLIVLRNLDPENDLCNCIKMYMVAKYQQYILVKRYIQDSRTFLIPRMQTYTNDNDYHFKLRRTQTPVRPAFAMNIHKSQGQILNHVGVYLKSPIFANGQLYRSLLCQKSWKSENRPPN